MALVKKWDEVVANISTLESYRNLKLREQRTAYEALIKRGTCFVVYKTKEGVSFAPSRFIGYLDNEISAHALRIDKDGRQTNIAIGNILGQRPEVDLAAETLYQTFCQSLGIVPSKTGTFGAARKFWLASDVIENVEEQASSAIEDDSTLTETTKEELRQARRGQGKFRQSLVTLWKQCCITECSVVSMLRASHIKPWSKSDNVERLDKFNGLLLSPNADALFDGGYITFTDSGDLLISDELPASQVTAFLAGSRKKIKFEPEHFPYLEYHRKFRFRIASA